jgi:hypothetical protein
VEPRLRASRRWDGRVSRCFTEWRPVYGLLKLLLELDASAGEMGRRGEVIRVGITPV